MKLFLFFLVDAALCYLASVVFLFRGLRKLRPAGHNRDLRFSIVIAARNEERNIGACLESIARQTLLPERFEVIVVDDRSTDATAAVCAGFAGRLPRLRTIRITATPAGIAPKKYAVSQGIAAAEHEIIVFTDADCIVPPEWLATIDRYFDEETGLVQGITAYTRPAAMRPLFFGLQAVDFLSHGIVAAAGIGAGLPLNSNANNLSFRKKAFEEVGGYGESSQRVVSGDDDLLLQRIAGTGKWKVRFMADPSGAVTTAPTPTLRGLFEQRKRWGSKTINYTIPQIAFLTGVFLFYCSLFMTLLGGIFLKHWLLGVFCGQLIIKILGEYLLMIPGTALFNQKSLRRYILPASLLQLPLVIAAVLLGVFGKFSWKGERYRREVK